MSLPEEDLTCSVCCDIFRDPVLLPCSHSFCRDCLKQCWDTGVRGCPICRKKGPKSSPTSNLALRNVCEALQQVKRQNSEDRTNCSLHGEKLKLFCLVDRQPICVVCQSSKVHKNHECLPTDEALLDCKDELEVSLKILQKKLDSLEKIHQTSDEMFTHIKNQTLETQKVIRSQFEQLHQVLHDEESGRLAALKKEEEEKIAAMKQRIKELSEEMLSVTETISVIQGQLMEDNIVLLKNFKAIQDRSKDVMPALNNMSGLLIDVAKHLSNLKYRVWEKLLDQADYTPVTLDPNTAHPCLVLSEDLTSLHYSKRPSCCPDNPERFHISAEVVGMTALDAGSHHWVVTTGSNPDWFLGVASSSILRNVEISARPENGFWTLCFRDGEFRAMTSPPTPLTVSNMPKQVKVQLDYNNGRVSFLDPADNSLIYEFTQTFTEPLFPYFYTQSSHPLRIMPETVLIAAAE
ncbi:zinc-binding protein A33 [Nematolebias whitei]|uniref:zinc-binding protein A33 n=1 Tax=Nematolebias whitei TaxID=451745 RepID=UPI00189910E1|nr:zinc-binding protein A33 [Nematolebias whitei]